MCLLYENLRNTKRSRLSNEHLETNMRIVSIKDIMEEIQ